MPASGRSVGRRWEQDGDTGRMGSWGLVCEGGRDGRLQRALKVSLRRPVPMGEGQYKDSDHPSVMLGRHTRSGTEGGLDGRDWWLKVNGSCGWPLMELSL